MGASVIRGIQDVSDDGGVPARAAACMKHYIAYSDPVNGHDRSPVLLPDRVLQQLYRPSFQAAIDAGVLTAMESYNDGI
jgi:beta-glucosidase